MQPLQNETDDLETRPLKIQKQTESLDLLVHELPLAVLSRRQTSAQMQMHHQDWRLLLYSPTHLQDA
jgi:uncharacterized protein YhhL (DUF1145 family)